MCACTHKACLEIPEWSSLNFSRVCGQGFEAEMDCELAIQSISFIKLIKSIGSLLLIAVTCLKGDCDFYRKMCVDTNRLGQIEWNS